MRKTIAKNMVESVRETASVTHTEEVDISELVKIREKEKVKAAKEGVKLTYLPFVIKALIAGLKKHPYLNSSIDTNEEGSQEIILKKYYNIGVGVDTPDGLLVFVIKGADQKSMLQLGKEIEDLAEKARQRTIDIGDLKGGTFTITNYGSVGGLFGTPIINPGECAILGIGRIVEKPLVVHGEIQIRNVLPLSVTFDHRIVDGAEVARFVNTLMEHLEDPDLLLVE
jgi:pyruvate dehydrogenase E2 component (dihydrolipoamide acetyltransferase)